MGMKIHTQAQVSLAISVHCMTVYDYNCSYLQNSMLPCCFHSMHYIYSAQYACFSVHICTYLYICFIEIVLRFSKITYMELMH